MLHPQRKRKTGGDRGHGERGGVMLGDTHLLHTVLSTGLGLACGLIFGWLLKTYRGTGTALRDFLELRGRVEVTESHQTDLADRFTKFQNRENLRGARESKQGDLKLEAEAAALLAERAVPQPTPTGGTDKQAIRRAAGLIR